MAAFERKVAMRWSQTLIPTLREVPAEAVAPSHQLMLRAGLVHQVAAGAYAYLPLGWRVLHRVMTIIREEMNAAGAVEVFLPSLQPLEWWEQTGRREAYGDNLFVLRDRHGRDQALGPTHEEVITKLFDAFVSSYKQLPLNLYQVQTKFRDEFRPRFGVLRSREFQMKDAYSFHLGVDGEGGLDATYEKMYRAYCRIFERCGIPYAVVEAESGPIGGSASHEFMVPSPTGEDTILSNGQGYAANVEKCEIGPRQVSAGFAAFSREPRATATLDPAGPTGELDPVHTPGCTTIDDVCKFMKVKAEHMLKTLIYATDDQWIVAVVRGDHELNEGKLSDACGAAPQMADDAAARAAGFAIGFVGPHVAAGRDDVTVFLDPDVAHDKFWATGANEVDHHVKHFHWQRDVLDRVDAARVTVADIRNAQDGDPAPADRGGGTLRESKGIEIGHVFKLGPKYTRALGVSVLDENQQAVTPIMGCYGIGVNRILAAALEAEGGHDDGGCIFPLGIAPYEVVITPIKYEPGSAVAAEADRLYAQLMDAGVDVLFDDRDERPGVKFKDADLIGIPLRLTVGDKGLANDQVEFKPRTADKADMVGTADVVERALTWLAEQQR